MSRRGRDRRSGRRFRGRAKEKVSFLGWKMYWEIEYLVSYLPYVSYSIGIISIT